MRVNAEVAELVDALASGASVRKNVGVRISLSAQCRKEVSAQGGQVLSGTLKKFAQKLEGDCVQSSKPVIRSIYSLTFI